MPPLSDDGGSEDDIVVARQVENFKCPLTATWFEDPVTSSDCSHTFSRAAIVELLRASPNGLISCPITGCSKNLSSNVLKPNAGLVRRMGRARELQTKRPNGSKTNVSPRPAMLLNPFSSLFSNPDRAPFCGGRHPCHPAKSNWPGSRHHGFSDPTPMHKPMPCLPNKLASQHRH